MEQVMSGRKKERVKNPMRSFQICFEVWFYLEVVGILL